MAACAIGTIAAPFPTVLLQHCSRSAPGALAAPRFLPRQYCCSTVPGAVLLQHCTMCYCSTLVLLQHPAAIAAPKDKKKEASRTKRKCLLFLGKKHLGGIGRISEVSLIRTDTTTLVQQLTCTHVSVYKPGYANMFYASHPAFMP